MTVVLHLEAVSVTPLRVCAPADQVWREGTATGVVKGISVIPDGVVQVSCNVMYL